MHTFCKVYFHFSSMKFSPSRSPCLSPFFVPKRHVSSSLLSQDEAGRSPLSSQVPRATRVSSRTDKAFVQALRPHLKTFITPARMKRNKRGGVWMRKGAKLRKRSASRRCLRSTIRRSGWRDGFSGRLARGKEGFGQRPCCFCLCFPRTR